ncbi:hypothetical protein [uncultured Alistipes sp.]|uniref:hypothetical protein n=1 Tax=uncultured Alistipes sp. TaxID=538949 RepID=UPI0026147893|nr:hypothetical protein [uncultured Alistipes sp.]
MEKEKVERTVVHLELLNNNSHYYFGSLAAIYEKFGKEDIGISYGSLRNFGLSADKPYKNKLCIIRKGVLITIPKQVK